MTNHKDMIDPRWLAYREKCDKRHQPDGPQDCCCTMDGDKIRGHHGICSVFNCEGDWRKDKCES